ncbi:hypothetical protein V7654_21825 [Bacillus sp. JJ1609]|uniref:hypothetical protein n=1 Tax=Bacillus sp. JJ1609 TaxID=3122977 RepID=UPI002FFF86B6
MVSIFGLLFVLVGVIFLYISFLNKINGHLVLGVVSLVVGMVFMFIGFQETNQKQEAFKEFVKIYSDEEVTASLEEYRRIDTLTYNGEATVKEAYDAADNAQAALSEAISLLWEFDTSDYPKEIRGELHEALSAIKESYHYRRFELQTAKNIIDNPKEKSLQTDLDYYRYKADSNASKSLSALKDAGEKLNMTADEIDNLMFQE